MGKEVNPYTKPYIPDIFISYSRKDMEKADLLAKLLTNEGWEVWKDNRINAGEQFEVEIIEALNNAKAVLVLWSVNSVNSTWVKKEAQVAVEQKKLKPVLIDDCAIPAPFDIFETSLLQDWQGEENHSELKVLYNGITNSVIPSRLDNVRKGYDPFFLDKGVKLMLPEVKGTADIIHYANFSIVMNPTRRMAWYVAYNMDGTSYIDGLPRSDSWMPDPLWPLSLQPSNAHFVRSGWHRGHLLSPGTVCWGDKRIAGIARRQANYWTNTTPQSGDMNVKWWLQLEKFERKIAEKREKAIGLSGPVFRDDDESFRDEFEKDDMFVAHDTYRIPKAFWKIIITQNGHDMEYCAFILDQAKLEKKAKSKPFLITDHLVSVKLLQEKTGLVFHSLVHQMNLLDKAFIDSI